MSRKERPVLARSSYSFSTGMRDYSWLQQNGCSNNTATLPTRRGSLSALSIKERTGRTQRSNSISFAGITELTTPKPELLGSRRRPSIASLTKPKEGKDANNNKPNEKYSLVVLGAGGVGKTALVVRFVTGRFLNEYDPTLEMTYEKDMRIGETSVSLGILDTAGSRETSYFHSGDGFIVVYSITDHYSFEVARQFVKLIKEVRKTEDICPVPIVLVGNKRDLRRGRCVSKDEAREVASEYGCSHYESSALSNRNVHAIFYNMAFQTRFTKMSNRETRKSISPQNGQHGNGFLTSVKQFFNPGSRRASLPTL